MLVAGPQPRNRPGAIHLEPAAACRFAASARMQYLESEGSHDPHEPHRFEACADALAAPLGRHRKSPPPWRPSRCSSRPMKSCGERTTRPAPGQIGLGWLPNGPGSRSSCPHAEPSRPRRHPSGFAPGHSRRRQRQAERQRDKRPTHRIWHREPPLAFPPRSGSRTAHRSRGHANTSLRVLRARIDQRRIAAAALAPHAAGKGRVNTKVLPSPGLLSTLSAPPIRPTSRRLIESPRPVPP